MDDLTCGPCPGLILTHTQICFIPFTRANLLFPNAAYVFTLSKSCRSTAGCENPSTLRTRQPPAASQPRQADPPLWAWCAPAGRSRRRWNRSSRAWRHGAATSRNRETLRRVGVRSYEGMMMMMMMMRRRRRIIPQKELENGELKHVAA